VIDAVVVAVGGMVGALARFELDGFIQDHAHGTLPVGTLAVNTAGSFILGLLTASAVEAALNPTIELLVATGFCGAFTTFSSLMFEATRLAQDGAWRPATRTLALNVVLGLAAAAGGLALGGVFG
jgi:CrcB protein